MAALQPSRRPADTLLGSTPEARRAFLLSLGVVLVFSEGWLKPFTGDAVAPADNGLIRLLYYPGYAMGLGLILLSPWRVMMGAVRTPLLWALVGGSIDQTVETKA